MAGPTPWILDNCFYDPVWLVFGRFRDQILVVCPDTSDIPAFLMTSCDKYLLIYFQRDATLYSSFISEKTAPTLLQ